MSSPTSSSLELSLKLRSTIASFGEERLKAAAEFTAKELKEKIAEDFEALHRQLLAAKAVVDHLLTRGREFLPA